MEISTIRSNRKKRKFKNEEKTTIHSANDRLLTKTKDDPVELTMLFPNKMTTDLEEENKKLFGNYDVSADNSSENKKSGKQSIGYLELYRYASLQDGFLIFIALIFTAIRAVIVPLVGLSYGDYLSVIIDRVYAQGTSTKTYLFRYFGGGNILTNATWEENRVEIINDSIACGICISLLTIIQFVATAFSIDLLNHTALRQATRIRIKLLQSMLRQDIGWYDVTTGNNIAVQINEDINKIRDGIGEKVGHFLRTMFGYVLCVALAFYVGWEVTSIVIASIPIVLITNAIVTKIQTKQTNKELSAYAIASNLVEEILGGIRTVIAFCGETKEVERYDRLLDPARKAVATKGLATGFGDGMMRFILFASTSLAYWYGLDYILEDRDKVDKKYTPAVLTIVFFGVINGADELSRTVPFLESFAAARGSGATVFEIIDRKSKIDSMPVNVERTSFKTRGDVKFQDVVFSYPSRPDLKVLRNMSLKISAGQTVALVGSSGNGKSTCLQLLQRFYDPDEGNITIDGLDIRNLNVSSLRSKIAMVGQEPVLFSTTIGENIRYGNPCATDKEIASAAQEAGAHNFISKLPQGYDTLVGEKGCQLSGGQKQRIAIARALIQNPNILLLDEATSALDYESEKIVQAALDRASKGRTTIVVSHRPSAIRSADRIVFIEKGRVVEDGSHDELIALRGQYYLMFSNLDSDGAKHVSVEKDMQNFEKFEEATYSSKDAVEETKIDSNQQVNNIPEKINYIATTGRILKFLKPEWCYLGVGILCSVIGGISYPFYSILFGNLYGALSLTDKQQATDTTHYLCILGLFVGTIVFFTGLFQYYLFNKTAVLLSARLRCTTFASMLKQEIAWYDDEKNGIGALSARLSGNASGVQDAFGYPLCSVIQCLTAFIVGAVMAYSYNWKLATICLIQVPLVVALVIWDSKHMTSTMDMEKKMMEQCTRIATEAISNIRTVASLRQEPHILDRFVNELSKVESFIKKKMVWRGVVSSGAPTISYFSFAFTLYYGGILLANGEILYANIIKISEALNYGAVLLSWAILFIPTVTAAVVSSHQLFKIINRQPEIFSPNIPDENKIPDSGNNIKFNNINFHYPTRPNVQVLKNLNLTVPEGKTVALVGATGSGKSTCIQLLQRFYTVQDGKIYLGRNEISSDISLKDLRSKLSIVSQEPVLFDRTIAENIAYGFNQNEIDMNNVIEAAKMANIHEFISSLPLGYETNLGSKGAQLSGGQKQRIAIARALIRNPKILLLDEATSALDLQGEQIVQQALDAARSGRTCLVIAHRLTTVQNADLIYVLQNGEVREQGTHSELLASNGIYAKLCNSQAFE